MLIRSGEAPAIGWSRSMLYAGFNILHRSVIRRQTRFAARITRTLSGLLDLIPLRPAQCIRSAHAHLLNCTRTGKLHRPIFRFLRHHVVYIPVIRRRLIQYQASKTRFSLSFANSRRSTLANAFSDPNVAPVAGDTTTDSTNLSNPNASLITSRNTESNFPQAIANFAPNGRDGVACLAGILGDR